MSGGEGGARRKRYAGVVADVHESRRIVVMVAARGVVAAGRWLVASMMCALVAHVAVYQSLLPVGPQHAYFAWYAPIVAGASVASVLAIVVGGLVSGSGAARIVGTLLPPRATRVESRTIGGLALAALAFLVAQESLERSLEAGAFTVATFDMSTWPMLVAVLALCATAVLAIGRTAVALSNPVAGKVPARRRRSRMLPGPAHTVDLAPHAAPLGRHAGLRAPPLVA